MTRPLLLDLFCGAGGASVGYHRAGFDVIGVDIKPQPHYPFEFIQADALNILEYPHGLGNAPDVIHTSPPCQRWSMYSRNLGTADRFPDLITPLRPLLHARGLPYVIENVEGSPLTGVRLCGSAFGLPVLDDRTYLKRHRIFESNITLWGTPCAHAGRVALGIYGNGTPSWHRLKLGRGVLADEWRVAMSMPWATKEGIREAIPPAYTQFIGEQLLEYLAVNA